MRRNLVFAYPLEQRARPYLKVLGSLICGKPFGFHVSLFSRSGNVGSRRLRRRLCRALSRKRTRFLHMVAAITFTDLLEDLPRTLPEPPFDFRRAPRCCRFPTPTPPALPVTKSIRTIHHPQLTASHPASLRNVHVPARHLSRFVSSLCVPPSSAHLQPAEQISLGIPKELLN